MRKIMFAVAAVVTAAVFTGCASVDVVPAAKLNKESISYSGKTIAHLSASTWGIYFFHIPILTPAADGSGNIALLQDTVTTDACIKMLTAKSKSLKATQTLNIISRTMTPAFFFSIKEVSASANAVR